MIFDRFAVGLESLEKTSGRIDLAKGLAVLLSELSPDETAKALYMVQGQLMPPSKMALRPAKSSDAARAISGNMDVVSSRLREKSRVPVGPQWI